MIVFVAGMSRSGSMWTFNVTRELIRRTGKVPLPRVIPPDETNAIREAIRRGAGDDLVYCLKTHLLLRPDLPSTKIICTYRDVREAMVSYMQFMHCGFDWALKTAESMMSVTDYYFEMHKKNIIRIRYDHILTDPVGVVREISDFLGFGVLPADMERIAEQFSRKRVRKFIESLDKVKVTGNGMIANPALREEFEAVGNIDGSFRVYDRKSAFQSHHITNSGERWRTFLTDEQQALITSMAKEWLIKYGFAP